MNLPFFKHTSLPFYGDFRIEKMCVCVCLCVLNLPSCVCVCVYVCLIYHLYPEIQVLVFPKSSQVVQVRRPSRHSARPRVHRSAATHAPSSVVREKTSLRIPLLDFPGGSMVKIHLPTQEMQERQLWSLDWEDPLEKEMFHYDQCSRLESPMDRTAWRATVHRITKDSDKT